MASMAEMVVFGGTVGVGRQVVPSSLHSKYTFVRPGIIRRRSRRETVVTEFPRDVCAVEYSP
jgi:hypothetical protein